IAALHLRVDTSAEGILLDDDPDRLVRDFAREKFGTIDEIIVVMIEAPDVFAPAILEAVRELSEVIRNLPDVAEVVSLTSVELPGQGAGFEASPIAGTRARPVPPDVLRARVLDTPILIDNLVSKDGSVTAINVLLREYGSDGAALAGAVAGVQAAAEGWSGPGRATVVGIPLAKVAIAELLHRDLKRLTPVTVVVVALLLFLTFRSRRGVVLPLAAIGAGEVLTLGISSLMGRTISVVSVVLPSVVLAIGCTYAVHILPSLGDDARRSRTRAAVFLSAFTSAIGFLALLSSRIHTIRDHGIFAASGVGCMLLAAVFLLPALDRLFPPRSGAAAMDGASPLTGAHALRNLAPWVVRKRRTIVVVSLLLMGASLLGLLRVRIETDYLAYFHAGHPVPRDINRASERLSGVVPMMVLIDSGRDGGIADPDMLRRIATFQDAVEGIPGINKTLALPDILTTVRRSLNGESASEPWIPDSAFEVLQLIGMIRLGGHSPVLRPYVDETQREANVYVRGNLVSSGKLSESIELIHRQAGFIFGPETSVTVTGTMQLLNKTSGAIARGIVWSVLVAIAAISLLLCVYLRSVKLGLLAMVPNLVPVAVLFGVMGTLGVSLSTGTSIAASIALGLIVDETIHFITAYRARTDSGERGEAALRSVYESVGPPIIWASVILTAGFAVLLLSGFLPLMYLGLFMAVAILVSLFCDLILLPALLLMFDG
ncbi:MAG: MMPL family transporter, partial [Deltaproteobacteria bacterium]|nr:MMPL family transporter [Deltaproteobacteria bacterium]